MKRFLLLVLVCLPLRASASESPSRPADMTAIRRVIMAYEDAWNRHDVHAFSLIFTPDAEFVNVRGIAYPGGRAGIERAHRPLFATMFRDSHTTTDRVLIRFLRPDVATADVYWSMTGSTDRAGRLRPLIHGLRSLVLTRDGGRWLIAAFHNMETAPPAGPGTDATPTGSPRP